MRRRRDQRNPGLSMTQTCDQAADLVTGKLSTFTWLCALCNLDLNLFGMGQIFGGDTEAARSDLLNFIVQRHMHCWSSDEGFSNRNATLGMDSCCPTVGWFSTLGWDRGLAIDGWIFAAFTCVGAGPQHVHRCCNGLMSLGAERAQRHRACDEAFRQAGCRLNVVERQFRTGRANL